jgi:MerR family transcriptional regulator, redox-sensitive transcriptional activator SoxR
VISTAQDAGISIGEVGRRTGLRASALRYYERAGLIRVQRRNAGHRVYDPSVFESLALIQLAQDAGFTIREIKTLVDGFDRATPASSRWQSLAQRKLAEMVARIERATRMRDLLGRLLECECETLGQCVRGRVAKMARRASAGRY